MIPSRYNIILKENDTAYWCNTLSHRFFSIPCTLSDKIESAISGEQEFNQLPDVFVRNLSEGGFLIRENMDELEVLKSLYQQAVQAKSYFLVILPTLNCNFNCWYCIQDHKPLVMTPDTIQNICAHIAYMVEKEGIEFLHIEWFGGEPFMYVKQIVEPIATYALKISDRYGIPFYHSATTNGYFLSDANIKILSGLDCRRYQITLDGPQPLHDSIKYQKNCESAFRHVLTNINNLLRHDEDVQVILRINYSLETIKDELANQVAALIDHDLRSRIIVTPKQVWQVKINKSIDSRFYEWLNKFDQLGFKTQKLDIVEDYIPCYANKKYYNAINYNGNVVKCTACDDLYADTPKGKLLDTGEIKWNEPLDKLFIQCTFD